MAHARAQFLRKIKTEKIAVSDTNLRAPSSSEGNIKRKISHIITKSYCIISFNSLPLCKIYFEICYVESLNRVRRKRKVSKEVKVAAEGNDSKKIVSKEIKVAAEENELDVKNGALCRL